MNWKQTAVVAVTALGIAGATAFAQQTQTPQAPQSPMMGQGPMGPGMMGGAGPGYGPRWRGDRDDDDLGWGMMHGRGGWGMGSGMMGGMGMGMMGGMGMGMMGGMGGMGMMGLGPIAGLDLNDTQRQQVLKVEDELRRKNWDVMGKMQDEMAKLRDSMWSGKRDRTAILAANKRMSDLRQQMLENSLDARDKAEAVLTPQQRDQLKRYAW